MTLPCCPNHPDSPAVGVCLSCGRLVCAECRGKLDGRIICPDCRAREEERSGRWRSVSRIALVVLLGLMLGWWCSRPGELPPAAERLETVAQAVERFHTDLGRWPAGLEELLEKPDGDSLWFGPYLGRELIADGRPADVEGHPLEYGADSRGVWLASAGPDGTWQTDLTKITPEQESLGDDILAWVSTE